ncbi:MAG: SRPBCC domain-containing protein [Actinomycetota bacterium]
MAFQPRADRIEWRLHLASPPDRVFDALASDEGRASFWAESAAETDGVVHFEFINGETYAGRILEHDPPHRWSVEYFGSTVTFSLEPDGSGGTDLTMTNTGMPDEHRVEVTAGWLNVLLPLKAMVDFGVDLHNHDPARSWDQAYVDH